MDVGPEGLFSFGLCVRDCLCCLFRRDVLFFFVESPAGTTAAEKKKNLVLSEEQVKKVLVFLFCFAGSLILSGESHWLAFAAVGADEPLLMQRRFISLQRLHKGLTRAEAEALLGDKVVIGYELTDEKTGQYAPLTIVNPYRTQSLTKLWRQYTVVYYLVGIMNPDGQVTEDELFPLVFQSDRLVGMGWEFLRQKIVK
jgi:hypothetical protein